MARPRSLAFCAIAVLAAALSAAGAEAAASPACDAEFHASLIGHMCPAFASAAPGSGCCEAVLLAAEHGGVPCLCMVAATARMIVSGIRPDDIIGWYGSCGGVVTATVSGAAAACSPGSPPPARAHLAASKEEAHLVATVAQPAATNTVEQWPWYGWVTLIAVSGAMLFATIALCSCIFSRCTGRLGHVVYWLLELMMRLRHNPPPAAGVEQLPEPLPREPPRIAFF